MIHRAFGDPEVEHVLERAEHLAGEHYDTLQKLAKAEAERDRYRFAFTAMCRVFAETCDQRDKALDYAAREQSHRLDIEGSDRLLRDIERMHELQHGGDAA